MSTQVILVFVILLAAVVMFSTEKIRNDVAAVTIMLALAWTGVLPLDQALSGFASNAVMAIIGVMILGFGIEKTGIMDSLARWIVEKGGTGEGRMIATVMAVTGLISSFMQNIGAVALFLPAVKKIGSQSGIPRQRLILPMAFAGIIGGTITMVASGPLIILNDLLADSGYEGFGMFSVTPIGLILLLTASLFFFFFHRMILPGGAEDPQTRRDELLDVYDLPGKIQEVELNESSPLIGQTIEGAKLWNEFGIHVLAVAQAGSKTYVPWRKTTFQADQTLAVFGDEDDVTGFLSAFALTARDHLTVFRELMDDQEAGFAELILPPDSKLKGRTVAEIALRRNYKIEPIRYIAPSGERLEWLDQAMRPGLKIMVFGRWQDLSELRESGDFVVITPFSFSQDSPAAGRKWHVLTILAVSILLILWGIPLPLSFLTAGIALVAAGVITMDEAYRAIDWKTVFLLAGLIPLGIAFEQTGAAGLVADVILQVVQGWPVFFILLLIGVTTAFFSLFMSNVAATVLLVPLMLILSQRFGIDAKGLALLVAVAASNSFILPTHQVNAYVMGADGLKTADFLRAGSAMSLIFLLVSTLMIYLFYI